MAKYIVEETYKPTYEKNYKLPMINFIPAFVWSIPLHQRLYPEASTWIVVGLAIAFMAFYYYLSLKPWIAAIPCVAGVIIFTAMFWVFADYIGNDAGRIAVKGLICGFFILLELSIFGNATIPWLESREANRPRIRVER